MDSNVSQLSLATDVEVSSALFKAASKAPGLEPCVLTVRNSFDLYPKFCEKIFLFYFFVVFLFKKTRLLQLPIRNSPNSGTRGHLFGSMGGNIRLFAIVAQNYEE